MKRLFRLLLGVSVLMQSVSILAAEGVFEVEATILDSTFYRHGKIEKDKPGGEVVYQVDLPQKTVTRTAVYNATIPKEDGGGLQADDTVYTIVYDSIDIVTHQRLIKAIGETGLMDGYETVVIGEDFVTTSRSSGDYFVLYTYKRTDHLSEAFRMKQTGNR